jgi:hypothetical protein
MSLRSEYENASRPNEAVSVPARRMCLCTCLDGFIDPYIYRGPYLTCINHLRYGKHQPTQKTTIASRWTAGTRTASWAWGGASWGCTTWCVSLPPPSAFLGLLYAMHPCLFLFGSLVFGQFAALLRSAWLGLAFDVRSPPRSATPLTSTSLSLSLSHTHTHTHARARPIHPHPSPHHHLSTKRTNPDPQSPNPQTGVDRAPHLRQDPIHEPRWLRAKV